MSKAHATINPANATVYVVTITMNGRVVESTFTTGPLSRVERYAETRLSIFNK